MEVVTIAERKALEVERLRVAGAAARRDLAFYAATRGIRFSIFGSFARDDLNPSSDFDVMVDGPGTLLGAARDAAEAICERYGLRPDVHLASEIPPGLSRRIARDAIVLP